MQQKEGSDNKLARNRASEPGFLVQFDSGAHKLAHNLAGETGFLVQFDSGANKLAHNLASGTRILDPDWNDMSPNQETRFSSSPPPKVSNKPAHNPACKPGKPHLLDDTRIILDPDEENCQTRKKRKR